MTDQEFKSPQAAEKRKKEIGARCIALEENERKRADFRVF
jgi:hypothetical protein